MGLISHFSTTRTRTARSLWTGLALTWILGAGAVQAQEGSGLASPSEDGGWGRWTPRLSSQLNANGQVQSTGWFSDYSFSSSSTKPASSGGLRATAGLVWGLGSARMASPDNLGLGVGNNRPDTRFDQALGTSSVQDGRTAAYLGLGYTHPRLQGWRLHADVGLAWRLTPGSLKLGPTDSGASLEDVLRNARLAPLMQLSASYTF